MELKEVTPLGQGRARKFPRPANGTAAAYSGVIRSSARVTMLTCLTLGRF
jgi:hypothetical protein